MIKIDHNRPTLGIEEIESVSEVISSNWIAQGNIVSKFEACISNYMGFPTNNAIALSNGASALFVSLKVLDLPRNSEVIIPSYVCSSLLNSIYLADLKPVVVDVNEKDFNVNLEQIQNNLTEKTKVIILPHMFGVPIKIDTFFLENIRNLGIYIIEDCATSLGSKYNNDSLVGQIGDITVFSFYASKFITTANGGMVFSLNKEIAEKIRDYRDFDQVEEYKPRFNFQMSDIQAAIGITQFKKLDYFLQRRNTFAQEYKNIFEKKGWQYQKPLEASLVPNNYRIIIRNKQREILKLKKYLKDNNIKTIIPIESFELLHNYLKLEKKLYPVSEKIAKETLSLPIYPGLSDSQFNYIIDKLLHY